MIRGKGKLASSTRREKLRHGADIEGALKDLQALVGRAGEKTAVGAGAQN